MCANIGIISDNYKCFAIKIRKYQYYFLHFLRKYRNVLHGKLRKYQYFIYLRTPISRRYSSSFLDVQNAGVINRKRISLDSTRIRREQNLIIFHPLFLTHPISYLLLILLSDALVFFDLVFKHRCKYTTFCEYKRLYKEKVVSLQRCISK